MRRQCRKNKRLCHRWAACQVSMAVIMLLVAGGAQGSWALSVGTYSAVGDYDKGRDTRIHMVPVSLTYGVKQWRLSVSSGYLWLDGYQTVDRRAVQGGCGCDSHAHRGVRAVEASGIADTTLRAKYRFAGDKRSPVVIDINAALKVPTADSDNHLGTGKHDMTLRVGSYWRLPWGWGVMDLGYKWREQPEDSELHDTAQGILGGIVPLSDTHTVGLHMKWREAAQTRKDPLREVKGFVNHKMDKHHRLTLLVVKGLSDASPDWGVSTQWRYAW